MLVDELGEDERARLASDPMTAISDLYGVTVRIRTVNADASCPVYGSYNPDTRELIVGEALSQRRMGFTALHELAHMLLDTTEVGYSLLDLGDVGELTEVVCDSFAGRILIPTGLVDDIVGEKGPDAADVVTLYQRSNASRAACAVRAVERIIGPGHVMIGDLDGVAQFTASAGTYRVAKGTPQGKNSPIARMGSAGRYRGDGKVTYRSGGVSDAFLADAVRHGEFAFAVLVQTQPAWGGLSIPAGDRHRPDEYSCEHCGCEHSSYTIHHCGIPTCPECGRCACEARTSQNTCGRCGLQKAAHLISNGICIDCD